MNYPNTIRLYPRSRAVTVDNSASGLSGSTLIHIFFICELVFQMLLIIVFQTWNLSIVFDMTYTFYQTQELFFHLTLDLILSSLRRENKKPCYEINKIQRRYTYFIVFDLNTWKVHKNYLITQATKQKLFKLPKRLNNNYLITQATLVFITIKMIGTGSVIN